MIEGLRRRAESETIVRAQFAGVHDGTVLAQDEYVRRQHRRLVRNVDQDVSALEAQHADELGLDLAQPSDAEVRRGRERESNHRLVEVARLDPFDQAANNLPLLRVATPAYHALSE